MVRVPEPEPPCAGWSFTGNAHLTRLADRLPHVAMRCLYPMAFDCAPLVTADVWTVAAANDGELAKSYTLTADGVWQKTASPPNCASWSYAEAHLPTLEAMAELLDAVGPSRQFCLIRAGVHAHAPLWLRYPRRWHADCRQLDDGLTGPLIDLERRWLPVDIDELMLAEGLAYSDPDRIVAWVVDKILPAPFRGTSCVWQLSGSAGLRTGAGPDSADRKAKLHLFFRSTRAIGCRDYHELLARPQFNAIDRACAVGTQILYTARPRLNGGCDPLPRRVGIHQGRAAEVDLGTALSEARAARTAKVERVHAVRATFLEPPVPGGIVVSYQRAWLAIAYNALGTQADGYRRPIFRMISTAVRNGEDDLDRLKARLRELVETRLHELGDTHKAADVERYLSDAEIEAAVVSSRSYWYGEKVS